MIDISVIGPDDFINNGYLSRAIQKYSIRHKIYLKITNPGENLKEVRIALNHLTAWSQPQIEQYLKDPYELELDLSTHDIISACHSFTEKCRGIEFYFIDQNSKRERILNDLGI